MIADTSAWIELFRGTGSATHLRLRKALSRREPLWMLAPVYQELLQGARSPRHFVLLQKALDAVPQWNPEEAHETARNAGLLYARCRWQGITVRSPHDCLIAACAIEAQEPILHADEDFMRIAAIDPRLKLVSHGR